MKNIKNKIQTLIIYFLIVVSVRSFAGPQYNNYSNYPPVKQEWPIPTNALIGEKYKESLENPNNKPISTINRLEGKITFIDKNKMIKPLLFKQIELLQESKIIALSSSDHQGHFTFAEHLKEDDYKIRIIDESFSGEISFSITSIGAKIDNLDITASKKK